MVSAPGSVSDDLVFEINCASSVQLTVLAVPGSVSFKSFFQISCASCA